jgi:hypothetical protein
MATRTQQEINDIGVRALVKALGKEDASRFIGQFNMQPRADTSDIDPTLPPFTPEEAHKIMMGMHDQDDQAALL